MNFNRRNFTKSIALAGAGSFIVPGLKPANMMNSAVKQSSVEEN